MESHSAPRNEEWYIWHSGKGTMSGPYTAEEVRRRIDQGIISHQDLASRGRADPWRPVSEVVQFTDSSHPFGGSPLPPPPTATPAGSRLTSEQLTAGVLAVLLGAFGAHHFYLGNQRLGVLYLVASVCTFGLGAVVTWVFGIIEGVQYLTSDPTTFARRKHSFLFREDPHL